MFGFDVAHIETCSKHNYSGTQSCPDCATDIENIKRKFHEFSRPHRKNPFVNDFLNYFDEYFWDYLQGKIK
jgi:hypothetical protein